MKTGKFEFLGGLRLCGACFNIVFNFLSHALFKLQRIKSQSYLKTLAQTQLCTVRFVPFWFQRTISKSVDRPEKIHTNIGKTPNDTIWHEARKLGRKPWKLARSQKTYSWCCGESRACRRESGRCFLHHLPSSHELISSLATWAGWEFYNTCKTARKILNNK